MSHIIESKGHRNIVTNKFVNRSVQIFKQFKGKFYIKKRKEENKM